MLLSVIIPAYNEEERLASTLATTLAYFDGLPEYAGRYEVLVVDDGSVDATAEIVRSFGGEQPQVRLLGYGGNRGKGYAVRHGMLEASGDWRLFCDADLATPPEEFEVVFAAMHGDSGQVVADIGIGSRPLRESNLIVHQPWYRELLGRSFNAVVQMLAVPGIHDTQCGFKIFSRRSAEDVFSRCRLDGFAFDAEALFLASRLGYKIAEAPIRWSHKSGSKVSMLRDGSRMVLDLLRIRGMHRSVAIPAAPPGIAVPPAR